MTSAEKTERVGVWMFGACGYVGTCVAAGLCALRRGRCGLGGLVTALPMFERLGLPRWGDLVPGGHEIRPTNWVESAQAVHARSGLLDGELLRACRADLEEASSDLRPGSLYGVQASIREVIPPSFASHSEETGVEAVERLAGDILDFQRRRRLDVVVAVNVASCEPAPVEPLIAQDVEALIDLADRPGALPSSVLHAWAALQAGCVYVNFTPSIGIDTPALTRLADSKGLPYMGRDGKTGETLIKSVLAPMFATRHLNVLSWIGHNMLGNDDGKTLNDPRARSAKVRSKEGTLAPILGYQPHAHVSIEYVPSLDDWKVAWDYIHFQGFLNTKMSLQFTWQGSDSMLAAPLVIDLARLACRERRRGASGPMTPLACFFKDPMGTSERDYFRQWARLMAHLHEAETLPHEPGV